jgi:small-conductance mechanosensitive channel
MQLFELTAVSDNVLSVLAITAGGLVLYQLFFLVLKKWARTKKRFVPILLQTHIYLPGFVLMLSVTVLIGHPYLKGYVHPRVYPILHHLTIIFTICAISWLLIGVVSFLRELIIHQYKDHGDADFSLRKANTKFIIIQRVLNFLIIFSAGCVILMTFNTVKQVGASLLASAGVVGLVLGFAAQKSLGTLFAGIQIAIAQPIRLGDVVIVEDKFGTIGEITLTFVIVNVWDGSRLIVPINYFLEKPFENWTRVSSEVISKVKVYADYSLPVEEVRKAFIGWVENSPLWDRRSCGLVVTGANDRTIEIRGTMSAKNSDDAYQLECYIREKMVAFITTNYPDSLPRVRLASNEKPS